jgi:hypothetical protein
MELTDEQIESSLKEAFRSGAPCLEIYSRRQDIGIRKCNWGVKHAYLTFEELTPDAQSTIWRYRWTEKARTAWK